MPAADLYRATINLLVGGVNCANVFHFQQVDADGGETPAESLKKAIETDLLPTWVLMLSNEATVQSVIVRRVKPTPSQPYVYNLASGQGMINESTEPPNLAVCASHYSSTHTKMGRGRNYFNGLPQGSIQGAIPTAAWVALFQTFKTKLLSTLLGGGSAIHWNFRIYSPSLGVGLSVLHTEQRMQLRVLRGRIA